MPSEVTIVVDVDERASQIPLFLRERGVGVREAQLRCADYVVGASDAVERKTVADLHRSVVSARLWQQLAAIRAAFERPYLLVEGRSLDRGLISATGIRGAILHTISEGVPILWSSSAKESALWLHLLARRAQATGVAPGELRTGRRRRSASPLRALATIPGIGEQTAHELLARFGSVALIAAASERELRSVRGVGRCRAELIRATLN
jgi:Fanconi anemia group M protein